MKSGGHAVTTSISERGLSISSPLNKCSPQTGHFQFWFFASSLPDGNRYAQIPPIYNVFQKIYYIQRDFSCLDFTVPVFDMRTFISELMDNGVDLSTVKNLAGHSDIVTTVRYDRRGEVSKRLTF
ncbi:MAG: hypothetical protein PUP93_13660 [Rhizonema sp. NSF051]|nr:hypothetical protein [Rhizonema sp. NSF051]